MPRPKKNAGWALAKKTFWKKKKRPPARESSGDEEEEDFARRLAAARAARQQQQQLDASSSDDEAWQDARRRAAGAGPAGESPPPARGPPARPRLAAAGPTTWAEAEPLDRDWDRGEGADGGLLWDDDAEGPAAEDPLGLGLRGGGAAAADFDACAYVRDVCGDAAFGELRAGRRALGGRLGEEERRRRGAIRENLKQFLRAAARLERFARALERLGGRGVREHASKPSAIVETARRRVARRFGALM